MTTPIQIELPYIVTQRVITEHKWNPNYGEDRRCVCGHQYHRHFDWMEDHDPVGCKYCECLSFMEDVRTTET